MKRIHVFLILLFVISTFAFSASYGASYGVDNDITVDNSTISLPLNFALKNEQYYEFGFTSDNNISWNVTSPLTEIELERDDQTSEEQEASVIVASARFKAYWKIISGYSLKIMLLANGSFDGVDENDKQVHASYKISRVSDNQDILIWSEDEAVMGGVEKESEIGSYSPDYANQDFSAIDSVEFEIVSSLKSSIFSGGLSEMTTILRLRVEVMD